MSFNNQSLLLLLLFSHCRVWFFATPQTATQQPSLYFTISLSLLKIMSIESVIQSNHHILCHLLLLLPSIFPSIRFFPNESTLCIRCPKYWSFSLSTSPSGLIFFRIDRFDLLDVQGTLKYLLQHYSSKACIFQCSAFFMVQLLHPYITTGKTVDLTIQIFVGKVMSLLFNILSRFVITFLLRSKCLLNSYLQSLSSVILEPKKMKSITVSTLSPLICCEVMGPDSRILVFWMLSFKPASFSTFIKRCLVPLHFLPLMLYHLHIWGCWYFSCQYWFHLMFHPAWQFAWCTLHIS